MKIVYEPTGGVCAREMEIEVEGGIVKSVQIKGGCMGNSQGLSRLAEGMKVADVMEKLQGIRCGCKSSSCPDQLAHALSNLCKNFKNSNEISLHNFKL